MPFSQKIVAEVDLYGGEASEVFTLRSRTAASKDQSGKFGDDQRQKRPVTEIGANRQGVIAPIQVINSKKEAVDTKYAVQRANKQQSTNSIVEKIEKNEIVPKLPRPRSRKLYLGSGKEVLNSPAIEQGDDAGSPVRLERPISRKLYVLHSFIHLAILICQFIFCP